MSHEGPRQQASDLKASIAVTRARMMAALHYEKVTVPGAEALAEWEKPRAAKRGLPVVTGSDDDLGRIADQFSFDDPAVSGSSAMTVPPRSADRILAAASQVRYPDDLYKWAEVSPPEYGEPLPGLWPTPSAEALSKLTAAEDLATGRPLDRVHILISPTDKSW